MSALDQVITDVGVFSVTSHYPRHVGRNARLGHHGSGGPTTAVVITTDSGHRGWGLTETPPGMPDDLLGREVADVFDVDAGVCSEGHLWADVALHDLAGVLLEQPAWSMLGAAGSRQVEVYDGAIYFDDLDPEDDPRGPQVLLDNCAADAALGQVNFKLKIGRGNRWQQRAAGDRRDIEVTRLIRDGWPAAKILVDANDGYDLDGVSRYLSAVADCDLYWIEEPFGDDPEALAALRRHLDEISPSTWIADGETSPDVEQILRCATEGSIDVVLMDVLSFGITRWRRLMPRLAEIGVRASPHAWGRPLKTLYAAQLAAGLGNIPVVEGVPGHTDGVDTSTYRFDAGFVTVSERPGFGLPVPGSPVAGRV